MTDPLTRLPDGTIKQVNPFTGTKVWTLPGRGARPFVTAVREPAPVEPAERSRICAFCWDRMLETPPEIARVVRTAGGWREEHVAHAEELGSSEPEFRLVPNRFEILPYDYWRRTHGWTGGPDTNERLTAYLATPLGREHVSRLVRATLRAQGVPEIRLEARSYEDDLADAIEFFAATHLVVIARRHLVDGAGDDTQLAGSGTLTPEEHREYLAFTIRAMHRLYRDTPAARYVAVFQNWLAPAGASFDHLHKQLVAIDELGTQTEQEVARLRHEPDLYARWGAEYAAEQGLVVARTPSAVAFAGVGHRYPSLEVHSLVPSCCPWDLAEDEVRDFADLLHACHAGTGAEVPSNEEWHHRPPSVEAPMPLRAVLKWRISTLAGFEGDTKIYVNTIDPWTLRDRAVARLSTLAGAGRLAPTVTVPAAPSPS